MYAGVAEVTALCPNLTINADSHPTLDQVLSFCRSRASELDAVLSGRGYATPVVEATSPIAFAWLRAASSYGAAADTEAASNPLARSDTGSAETARLGYLLSRWKEMLLALRDGHVVLSDATTTGTTDDASRGVRGPYSGASHWIRRGDAYDAGYADPRGGSW